MQSEAYTDIIQKGWVANMPAKIRPYLYLMRLDRPIGTWLLLLPGWWAILLAGGLNEWATLSLFAIGAVVMRGAGCVVNDLWDRNLDGQVERTRLRPIPSGDVTIWQAMMLLFVLSMIGLIILLQFNRLTILIGIASLAFIALYPLMKRWTWWPQAFLGLTFNFGAIMGWTAVTDNLNEAPVILYISGIFWTLGYDTIYALQDRDDDALVGIKSTARLFSEKLGNVHRPVAFFYIAHFLIMLLAVAFIHELSWYWIVFVLPLCHLIWQVKTLNPASPPNALARFKSNRDYGLLICMVLILLHFI